MKITDFRVSGGPRGTRVSATLSWEDSDRADAELYFASPRLDAPALMQRPEPFLIAAYPLAMLHGERRVRIDGVVCPRVREGLIIVAQQWRTWFAGIGQPDVEAAGGLAPAPPRATSRAGMLLSGGVDSLAMLRRNRLEFEERHPGAIRRGIFVFGLNTFDFDDGQPVPERRAAWEAYGERLGAFVTERGVEFVPVETNIRALYPDFTSWTEVGWALGTISPGVALGGDLTELWLASNGLGLGPGHWSQHQFMPWVSSSGLDIRVGERAASRLEGTRLIAEWEGAGEVVRSCYWHRIPEEGRLNCGSCEKCVRTALALVALGREEAMPSFGAGSLTAASVDAIADSVGVDWLGHYEPLRPLLRSVGRTDLADAVDRLVQSVRSGAESGDGWLSRVFGRRS